MNMKKLYTLATLAVMGAYLFLSVETASAWWLGGSYLVWRGGW